VFAIGHGGIVTADEARVCKEVGGFEIGFGFEGSEEAVFPLRELGFCSRFKHEWCRSSGDIHSLHRQKKYRADNGFGRGEISFCNGRAIFQKERVAYGQPENQE
jgi:hypothetical protein